MITASVESSQIGSQVVPQIGDIAGAAPGKLSSEAAQDNTFRAAYAANLGEETTVPRSSSAVVPGTLESIFKQALATGQAQAARTSAAADSAVKSSTIGLSAVRVTAVPASTVRSGLIQDAAAIGDQWNTARGPQPAVDDKASALVGVAGGVADKAAATAQIAARDASAAVALKSVSAEIAASSLTAKAIAPQATRETSALALVKGSDPAHTVVTTDAGRRKGDVSVSSAKTKPVSAQDVESGAATSQVARAFAEPLPPAALAQLLALSPGNGQVPVLPAALKAPFGSAGGDVAAALAGSKAPGAAGGVAALGSQPIYDIANGTGPAPTGANAGIGGDGASGFGGFVGTAVADNGPQKAPESGGAAARDLSLPAQGGATVSSSGQGALPGDAAAGLLNLNLNLNLDLNRSIGVSGLVAASGPGLGGSAPVGLERSIRQPEAVPSKLAPTGTLSSTSKATGIGITESSAAGSSKLAAAGGQAAGLKTRSAQDANPFSDTDGLLAEAKTVPAAGPGEVPNPARFATDNPLTAIHAAGQAAKLPELAHSAGGASQSLIAAPAEARERAARVPGEDRAAAGAADSASLAKDEVSTAIAPASDVVNAPAPVLGSAVAGTALHTSVEAAAVSVHPGGLASAASAAPSGISQAGASQAGFATNRSLAGEAGGGQATQPSTAVHAVESQRTLLATPTALEVGVQSGTQGWLKIRAEVGGQGEVKASLDAPSAVGRDLLHSQLPALNAFLHGEQVPVTATLAERSTAVELGAGGTAAGTGGGGFGASSGSLLQGDGGQGHAGQNLSAGASERAASSKAGYDSLAGLSDPAGSGSGFQAGTSPDSGRWLNVRV